MLSNVDLLGEGAAVLMDRILTDDDFRKIRALAKRSVQEKEDQLESNIEQKYMNKMSIFDEHGED